MARGWLFLKQFRPNCFNYESKHISFNGFGNSQKLENYLRLHHRFQSNSLGRKILSQKPLMPNSFWDFLYVFYNTYLVSFMRKTYNWTHEHKNILYRIGKKVNLDWFEASFTHMHDLHRLLRYYYPRRRLPRHLPPTLDPVVQALYEYFLPLNMYPISIGSQTTSFVTRFSCSDRPVGQGPCQSLQWS